MQNNHLAQFSSDIKHAEPDLTKRLVYDVGFDSVRPDILHRAVAHQLAPNELAKLQDAESTKDLAQAAPTLEALLPLLRLYFDILSKNGAGAGAAGDVNAHFLSYVGQLAEFAKEHGWSAVLDYHLAFHGKRLSEMAKGGEGAFAAWAVVDGELWAKHLQGKKKAASRYSLTRILLIALVALSVINFVSWTFAFASTTHRRLLSLEIEQVEQGWKLFRLGLNMTRQQGMLDRYQDMVDMRFDIANARRSTSGY